MKGKHVDSTAHFDDDTQNLTPAAANPVTPDVATQVGTHNMDAVQRAHMIRFFKLGSSVPEYPTSSNKQGQERGFSVP